MKQLNARSATFMLWTLLAILALPACQTAKDYSLDLSSSNITPAGTLILAGGAGDGMGFEGRVTRYFNVDASTPCATGLSRSEILVTRTANGITAQLAMKDCVSVNPPTGLTAADLIFAPDGSGKMAYQGVAYAPAPTGNEALLDNPKWTKYGVTLQGSQAPAPDGTSSAYLVQETALNDYHFVQSPSISFNGGAVLTASIYLKAGGRTEVALKMQDPSLGNYVQVDCDLSTTTTSRSIQVGSAVYKASGIENLTNGWSRCWLDGSISSSAGAVQLLSFLSQSASVQSYPGDPTAGVYLWGGQVLLGF